jgi:hypothetical protein
MQGTARLLCFQKKKETKKRLILKSTQGGLTGDGPGRGPEGSGSGEWPLQEAGRGDSGGGRDGSHGWRWSVAPALRGEVCELAG